LDVINGNEEVVRKFLRKGVNIAKDGYNVIKLAANNGHAAVLEILIHKAHEHDSALTTPVYRELVVAAAVRGDLPVVDLLLKMKGYRMVQ
jgi:Ankyrin repeats (3 copies)